MTRAATWRSCIDLGKRIRAKLAGSGAEGDRPVLDLTWDYPEEGEHAEPSAAAILAELNGYAADGSPLASFAQLADDGSTRCGSWIHAGCFAGGVNQTARRKPWQEQSCGRARVGLGLAGQPADPVQPGLGRSRRPAVERGQGLRLVGRAKRASGPARTCPTSRRTSRRTTCPSPALRARPRSAAPTRSSCSPTARRRCSCRGACRTGRCPRISRRPSHRSATASTSRTPARSRSSTRDRRADPRAARRSRRHVPVTS